VSLLHGCVGVSLDLEGIGVSKVPTVVMILGVFAADLNSSGVFCSSDDGFLAGVAVFGGSGCVMVFGSACLRLWWWLVVG
jgi:hypothetical protein